MYEAICRAEYKLERKGKKAEGKKKERKKDNARKGSTTVYPIYSIPFPLRASFFFSLLCCMLKGFALAKSPSIFFSPSPPLPLSVSLPPSLSLHSLRIIFSMTMSSLPETYFFATRALRKGTTLHLNTAFFTMSWKCVIVNGDASPTITRTIYFTLVKAG